MSDDLKRRPDDWKTGDEPMTSAQAAYLETLSREAGVEHDPDERLTKAEAAKRIEELQEKTGRGESAMAGAAGRGQGGRR